MLPEAPAKICTSLDDACVHVVCQTLVVADGVVDGAERRQGVEIDKVCDANGRGVEHNHAQDRKRDQIQKELLGVVALRLAWKLLDLDGVLEVLVAQHPQSNQL